MTERVERLTKLNEMNEKAKRRVRLTVWRECRVEYSEEPLRGGEEVEVLDLTD